MKAEGSELGGAVCPFQPKDWNCGELELWHWGAKVAGEGITAIVSAVRQPPLNRNRYHFRPHPRSSPLDSRVVCSSTVRGHVDVALWPASGLVG